VFRKRELIKWRQEVTEQKYRGTRETMKVSDRRSFVVKFLFDNTVGKFPKGERKSNLGIRKMERTKMGLLTESPNKKSALRVEESKDGTLANTEREINLIRGELLADIIQGFSKRFTVNTTPKVPQTKAVEHSHTGTKLSFKWTPLAQKIAGCSLLGCSASVCEGMHTRPWRLPNNGQRSK
jgi:hypothetical protein